MAEVCQLLAEWMVLFILEGLPIIGWIRGVRVYEAFVEGASEGFSIAIRLMPFLIAMLVAVNVFRASGAMDIVIVYLEPCLAVFHIPPDLVPLALLRPFSGTASLGVTTDILSRYGADSLLGLMASTAMGSTDTTFYIVSVYFGAVGITRARYAPFVGVCGDIIGFLLSVWSCRIVFG